MAKILRYNFLAAKETYSWDTDEPVANSLSIEGLVWDGGLVGEGSQNWSQAAAHL